MGELQEASCYRREQMLLGQDEEGWRDIGLVSKVKELLRGQVCCVNEFALTDQLINR